MRPALLAAGTVGAAESNVELCSDITGGVEELVGLPTARADKTHAPFISAYDPAPHKPH